jgi:hypothetical protein
MEIIEVGDRIKLSVSLIKAIERKLGGISLVVEVINIVDEGGVKTLHVKDQHEG